MDTARRLPRPAPAVLEHARQALAPPGTGRARRGRGAAVPRPGVRLRQQRLGRRRRADRVGRPLIAATPTGSSSLPGSTPRCGRDMTPRRHRRLRLHVPWGAGGPALRPRGRGRLGDHQRVADYQDIYVESLDDVVDGHEETIAVRGADPVTIEVLATDLGSPSCSPRSVGAGWRSGTPPLSWATWASRRCSRCCGRAPSTTSTAPSTPGWRRSTTWSSPTAAARSGSATPAGCRCAPRPTGAASSPADGGEPGRAGWSCRATTCRPTARSSPPTSGAGSESELLGNEFAPPHRARPDPRAARAAATTSPRPTSRPSTATRSRSPSSPLCALVRDLGPGPRGRSATRSWSGTARWRRARRARRRSPPGATR